MRTIKNQKINILHLTAYLSVGGASKLLTDALKIFNYKDLSNNILVVLSSNVEDINIKNLAESGCKYYIFPENDYKFTINIFLRLIKLIRKHNINIIHCDGLFPKKWAIILKLFNPDLKLIYTVHGAKLISSFSKLNRFAGNMFFDAHIAISNTVFEECKAFFVKNTVKIYNGIDLKKFANNKAAISIVPGFLKIINVSRIDYPTKGQDILIKALGECRKRGLSFHCKIVGGVSGDQTDKTTNQYQNNLAKFEEYKMLVRDLNLEDNVSFLGNRDDIPKLLAESDLFILPSRSEGFGLALVEAMTAGLPVISSNIDGLKELITPGFNGLLFKSEDYIDLADKITELYNDRQKMLAIAQAGFEYSKNFDINIMCEKYLQLYKDCTV